MSVTNQRWEFEDEQKFLEKLEELVAQGTPTDRLDVITPIHVPQTETILKMKHSPLRFFTLAGALTGLVSGFGLTIFTVLDWPIITGGKPLISIPPFIIIAFALTILLGSLASFAGFLILGRLPSLKYIQEPVEHENRFIILLGEGTSQ
jgi:hypothetical protein